MEQQDVSTGAVDELLEGEPLEESPEDPPLDPSSTFDDGEFAEVTAEEERPAHRVVCMVDGCRSIVTYRPTILGGGFTVIDRGGMDLEVALGMGPNGRPICPVDGHGEMTLADESLPAADAIAQVASAVQGELPGVFPDFNWAGAGKDMAEQAVRVNAFKAVWSELAEKAKKAKKNWDDAEDLLTKMGVEYDRRARAKAEPNPTPIDRSPRDPCIIEAKGELCAICDAEPSVVTRLMGSLARRDAQAHVDDNASFLLELDVEETVETLANVGLTIRPQVAREWTKDDRELVRTWADAEFDHDQDQSIVVPPRPAILGTAHVAGEADENGSEQSCKACGQVIWRKDPTNADDQPWAPGLLIGVDCAGATREAEHHYPERKKKKPASRAKDEPAKKAAAKTAAKKKKR